MNDIYGEHFARQMRYDTEKTILSDMISRRRKALTWRAAVTIAVFALAFTILFFIRVPIPFSVIVAAVASVVSFFAFTVEPTKEDMSEQHDKVNDSLRAYQNSPFPF